MASTPEDLTLSATAQLGAVGGGISQNCGAGVANDTKSPGISPQALAIRLSEVDSGLKKGYMHALMQFADDDDNTMPAWNDDIDAESVRSCGEERQHHGPHQEPNVTSTTFVGAPLDTGGNDGLGVTADMSFRISRVPYTWQPGEALEAQDRSTPSKIVPDPSTPIFDSQALDEVFQSLTFAGSDDLSLQLPGLQPSVDKDANMSTMSMTLETVKKESTGIGITISNFDSSEELGSTSTGRPRHPSISTGRPSTSTTQSSGSMSTGSSAEGRQQVRASSPRRPGSIFSRFKGRGGGLAAGDDNRDFIERRSLTPHELLAPLPRQDHGSDKPLPLLPTGESDADPAEASLDPAISVPRPKGNGKPVFGVDLNESIRLAPMRIRISHRGSSTSYRTFPLGVYKCCEFIRRSGNTDHTLFSSPGDAFSVSQLRDTFNSAPYGETFDFSSPSNRHYTVYDAGRLILLYLQALPKPLVSASVVKGWVMLARQEGAIEPPAPRPIESGLDFWAEALNRLSVANRNLTKHLLTLFAETVTRRNSKGVGSIGEADARNLAAAVSRALFHLDDGGGAKGNVKNLHATLALAFVVRKRGEYLSSLGDGEGGFLPSNKEMMEWKGQ